MVKDRSGSEETERRRSKSKAAEYRERERDKRQEVETDKEREAGGVVWGDGRNEREGGMEVDKRRGMEGRGGS